MGKGRIAAYITGAVAAIAGAITAVLIFIGQINLIFQFIEWIVGLF